MHKTKASPPNRTGESHPYLTSLIAFALIVLCLWASQWQFQRGVDRHHRNYIIQLNANKTTVDLTSVVANIESHEWQIVRASGRFDSTTQILLRNQYFEGKYGFDLLTLFLDDDGHRFWVNRGWIAPGKNAKSAPITPAVPNENLLITARVRLDESLPQGSFFALPAKNGGKLVEEWNAQSKTKISSEIFYLDLISASNPDATPTAPNQLPELSDGPHMAYALQWLFFAGLVLYGRLLLRRAS